MEEFRDYVVLKEIGRGSMGVVYLARHKMLNTRVALKVIRENLICDDNLLTRSRFIKEAQLLSRLNHPNILRLRTCFEDTNRLVIATDYLSGKSLAEVLKEHHTVSLEFFLHILTQLIQGVAHAHKQNVIHRDHKPSNVFITTDGTVKILDFGVGKDLGSSVHITATGVVIGTPAFMPPELLRTQKKVAAKHIGPEGDVYAIGVIAYRMLSGTLPYNLDATISSTDALAELAVHYTIEDPIQPLSELCPEVPRNITAIIMRCLSLDATRRPQSNSLLKTINGIATIPLGNSDQYRLSGMLTYFPVSGDSVREKSVASDKQVSQVSSPEVAFETPPAADTQCHSEMPRIVVPAQTALSALWRKLRIPVVGVVVVSLSVFAFLYFYAGYPNWEDRPPQTSQANDVIIVGDDIDVASESMPLSEKEKSEEILPANKETATVSIVSIPLGCNVEIDGEKLTDLTPMTIRGVGPGKHSVVLKKKITSQRVQW